MKVIAPIVVSDAASTTSNVTEDDHAEWDAATVFAANDFVIVKGVTHKVYKSAQASNVANDPTTDNGTWWIAQGATNRWKAFDKKISDQVSRTGSITYSIIPTSLVTGIAFFGLDAGSVRVQVFDTQAIKIYDVTRDIVDNTDVVDWFTYFTEDVVFDTEALFVGLPAYNGYRIDITIDAGAGVAQVGQIVLGKVFTLGNTLPGSNIGIKDYSTKERDDFGNAIVVERPFSEIVDFRFSMNPTDARRVQRLLAGLRATPVVFFAGENITHFGATVYGFFKGMDIPLEVAGKSFVSLEVEGLV